MSRPSAARRDSQFFMLSYSKKERQRPDPHLDLEEQFRRDDDWRKLQQARADRATRSKQTELSLQAPSRDTRRSALPLRSSTRKRPSRPTETPSKPESSERRHDTERIGVQDRTLSDHRRREVLASFGSANPPVSASTTQSRPVTSFAPTTTTKHSERKATRGTTRSSKPMAGSEPALSSVYPVFTSSTPSHSEKRSYRPQQASGRRQTCSPQSKLCPELLALIEDKHSVSGSQAQQALFGNEHRDERDRVPSDWDRYKKISGKDPRYGRKRATKGSHVP